MPLSAAEFVDRWSQNAGRERASSQSHFLDLCEMLGVPAPHHAAGGDPSGESYTFERPVAKAVGGKGFADVWKRGVFGWEYKGLHANLETAFRQLRNYSDDLENPPLLVVSDMDRIEVHTNFTNTKPQITTITLDDLRTDPASALDILRKVMTNPDALKPQQTPDEVTRAAAEKFATIARSLQDRGHDPEAIAHFLNRVLFCLFAEDEGLLPRRLMTDLIESRAEDPEDFTRGLSELFTKMSLQGAEYRHFGTSAIEWFNGGLFDGADVIPFTREELRAVREVSNLDWSQVGAVDPRHAVRARSGPGQARPVGRALHRHREDPHGRRAGGDAAAATRVRGDARTRRRASGWAHAEHPDAARYAPRESAAVGA